MTPHFSLWELTFSETATRRGLLNDPDEDQRKNLLALSERILEPARAALGPIRVTSGYRSPEVNALVGGSPRSQHMSGKAVDCISLNAPLEDLCRWLFQTAPFDQLIWEFGRWVHVSLDPGEPGRHQVLAASHSHHLGTVYRIAETPEQAFSLVARAS